MFTFPDPVNTCRWRIALTETSMYTFEMFNIPGGNGSNELCTDNRLNIYRGLKGAHATFDDTWTLYNK